VYCPHIKDEAYIPLVLVPDTAAVAIMIMLLWESRMRLPDHLWTVHTLARWAFGILLVAVGLFVPLAGMMYYATRVNNGAAEKYFFVEPTWFWNSGDGSGSSSSSSGGDVGDYDGFDAMSANNSVLLGKGAEAEEWRHDGDEYSNRYRSINIQQCQLLRSRSLLTFIRLLLVLVELLLAFCIGEFRARRRRPQRLGFGSNSSGGSGDNSNGGGREYGTRYADWTAAHANNGADVRDRLARQSSVASSELWYDDQLLQDNRHHHQQQHHPHNNDNGRSPGHVEEMDYEDGDNQDDEHGKESEQFSRATSSRPHPSSPRALFSHVRRHRQQQQHRDRERDGETGGIPLQDIAEIVATIRHYG